MLAWVVIASLGRAATLKGLLSYFWADDASKVIPFPHESALWIEFLRAGLCWPCWWARLAPWF